MITLIHLLGGIALLIWGVGTVRNAILKVVAGRITSVIRRHTKNRFAAASVGLSATMLLQSSMATAYLASSLSGTRIITVAAATAVLLGADVGSALIAQIVSRGADWISPILIFGGVVVAKSSSKPVPENIGRAIVGLGLILLSLSLIKLAFLPLASTPELSLVVSILSSQETLLLLVGLGLTILAHSSLAIVLVIAAMAGNDILQVHPAIFMVIGANIGSALMPWLSVRNSNRDAELPTLANLITRTAMAGLAALAMWSVADMPVSYFTSAHDNVLAFHLGLNLFTALVGLTFLGPICRLCDRIAGERKRDPAGIRPLYLNQENLDEPSLALSEAMRESLRMGDLVQEMLADCFDIFKNDDRELVRDLAGRDDSIDRLHRAIKDHIAQLLARDHDAATRKRAVELLSLTTNLEHIGDIVDRSILELANKRIEARVQFSEEGLREIETMHGAVCQNLNLALAAIVSEDQSIVRTISRNKERIRSIERRSLDLHIQRLAARRPETMSTSTLHVDVLRDFKRINSHVMATVSPLRKRKAG